MRITAIKSYTLNSKLYEKIELANYTYYPKKNICIDKDGNKYKINEAEIKFNTNFDEEIVEFLNNEMIKILNHNSEKLKDFIFDYESD